MILYEVRRERVFVCVRVTACRQPLDLVLAVDTSTSVGRLNTVRVFDYCQSLMIGVDRRSRFALVTFSDRARLVHNFTDQIGYSAVDSLSAATTAARSTDTAGALRLACQLLSDSAVHRRRLALLIVDGRCASGHSHTLNQSQLGCETAIPPPVSKWWRNGSSTVTHFRQIRASLKNHSVTRTYPA